LKAPSSGIKTCGVGVVVEVEVRVGTMMGIFFRWAFLAGEAGAAGVAGAA